jgi:hypothetical protein
VKLHFQIIADISRRPRRLTTMEMLLVTFGEATTVTLCCGRNRWDDGRLCTFLNTIAVSLRRHPHTRMCTSRQSRDVHMRKVCEQSYAGGARANSPGPDAHPQTLRQRFARSWKGRRQHPAANYVGAAPCLASIASSVAFNVAASVVITCQRMASSSR